MDTSKENTCEQADRQMKSFNLNDLYAVLEQMGRKMHLCASVWGSLQRNEITPTSDIDIICYSNTKTNSTTLRSSLEKELSNYTHNSFRLDIAFISGSPYDYGLLKGTNYHSIYFSDRVVGDSELSSFFEEERERLRNNIELSIREFFNILTSYYGLARVLNANDFMYTKFSLNGTNKWVRIVQAAQLRWHHLIGKTSKDIIAFLCRRYHLDTAQLLDSYELDFDRRIKSEMGELTQEHTATFTKWHKLFNLFIIDFIPWIQSNYGITVSLFQKFCQSMNVVVTDMPVPRVINTYAESVINAFVEEDPQKIESILTNNKSNWWTMVNLCVNEHVPPEFLERIVFPSSEKRSVVGKSVLLYIAKNKNTSKNTLLKILNTNNLREIDYLSAQNNLDSKNQQS